MGLDILPQDQASIGPKVFDPKVITPDLTSLVLAFDQNNWPNAGDLAIDYSVEVSLDAGKTWLKSPIASGNIYDTDVPARRGSKARQIKIGCSLPDTGNPNRQVRFSTDLKKPLDIAESARAI